MSTLGGPSLRIDKLLFFLRLAPSRARAAADAETGHIRIDGRRIDRAHCPVRVGQAITMMRAGEVIVFRILALPQRRGPPTEARRHYERLDGAAGATQQQSARQAGVDDSAAEA